MKKLIVLLLAITMVGAVFADDAAPAPSLTWGGYFNTGIQYDTSTDSLYLMGAKYVGKASRLRLNADYANGDFGVHFRLQSNDATTTMFSLTQALVWGNFLNKMVYAKVGLLNDYTWATPYNSYGGYDGKPGAQIQLKPISGLNFGVILPIDSSKTVSPTNVLKDMIIGAKYSAKGLADVTAELDLGTAANAFIGSVNVTAVKDLTAQLEAKITDIADFGNTAYFDEYISYALGDVAVGAYVDQTFGSPFAWSVAPEVSYTMGSLVAYASFTYGSDNSWSINPYLDYTLNAKSDVRGYVDYASDGTFTIGADMLFNF